VFRKRKGGGLVLFREGGGKGWHTNHGSQTARGKYLGLCAAQSQVEGRPVAQGKRKKGTGVLRRGAHFFKKTDIRRTADAELTLIEERRESNPRVVASEKKRDMLPLVRNKDNTGCKGKGN